MDDVLALDFVNFPRMEVDFDAWQKYYFPKAKKRYYESLNIKGSVETIQGAVVLAAGAVGGIVVPKQCIENEYKTGELFISAPSIPQKPLQNTIYVGLLSDRTPTRRTQQVMDWFFAIPPEVAR